MRATAPTPDALTHSPCHSQLEVELRKRRSFLPDVSYGRKNVSSCTSSAPTANWGNPGSGDFFDQFWHYDFGTLSAGSVRVRY